MAVTAGLIGFGLAGRVLHAPLLLAAGIEIRAVVTRQSAALSETLPHAEVLASDAALFARRDIDLAVIVTPNHLHFSQAAAALKAGKHVVIDKPMTLQADQADELIRLATTADRRLSVFHNRRWDSDFLTLRQLIDAGRLGGIETFEMRWDRFRPTIKDRWKEDGQPGGGVLYDLGPHMIDQVLQLFGRPEWIESQILTQRTGARTDDGFEITMGKGPLRIHLGVSSLSAAGLRYRIQGSRASFLKNGMDVQEDQLREGLTPAAAGFGMEPATQSGQLISATASVEDIPSQRGCWLEFYRRMRASMETGSEVPVQAADAREVIAIIEAARLSSRERRRVVIEP